MNRENALNIVTFGVALLFFYAAISKVLDMQKFQVQLGQSAMLGFIAVPLSYGVPILEIFLAIFLFVQKTRLAALYLSLSLMVMFTVYIVVVMSYSYYVPCSCGGILGTLGWKYHLLLNGAYVIVILVGITLVELSGARRSAIVERL